MKCKHFADGVCRKTFKDMTFPELVNLIRGNLIISLGKGNFHDEVYFYSDLILRWQRARDAELIAFARKRARGYKNPQRKR